jgi:hypothetical protein
LPLIQYSAQSPIHILIVLSVRSIRPHHDTA